MAVRIPTGDPPDAPAPGAGSISGNPASGPTIRQAANHSNQPAVARTALLTTEYESTETEGLGMPESCIVMRLAWLPSWALWLLIVCVSATSAYFGSRAFGWSIDWGSIADWAAAGGAFFAAFVALRIANQDRELRVIEQEEGREEASKIQARLVQVEATNNSYSPTVHVKVVNFGPLPVLDVDLVAASWIEHPQARWGTNWKWSGPIDRLGPIEPLAHGTSHHILHPRSAQDDETATYWKTATFDVCFAHRDRDVPILNAAATDDRRRPTRYEQLDMDLVIITVHFTTADGLRWQVIVQGGVGDDPVRVQPRSREDRWLARIGLSQ